MGLPGASAKAEKLLPSHPAAGGGAPPCAVRGAGLRGDLLRSLIEKAAASKGEMSFPHQASEGSAVKTWMWRGERVLCPGGRVTLGAPVSSGSFSGSQDKSLGASAPPHLPIGMFRSQTLTSKHAAAWLGRQPAKLPVKSVACCRASSCLLPRVIRERVILKGTQRSGRWRS